MSTAARPGKVLGAHFQAIMGSLMGAKYEFPELKTRVDAMVADEWYPWAEYCEMLHRIVGRFGDRAAMRVGVMVVFKGRELFRSQGFDSADKILKNWGAIFSANIHDADPADMVDTVKFAPGHVVIEAGPAQPASIVEGYMRGFVEAFGGSVKSFEHSRSGERNRLEMTYS